MNGMLRGKIRLSRLLRCFPQGAPIPASSLRRGDHQLADQHKRSPQNGSLAKRSAAQEITWPVSTSRIASTSRIQPWNLLQLGDDCALFSTDQRFSVRAAAKIEPDRTGGVRVHDIFPVKRG